jgi:hypothetical protein
MVRRDKIEWLRDSLATADRLLRNRGDIGQRLAQARERVISMHLHHMPTKEANAALSVIRAELDRLADAPPTKTAHLAPLRHAIAEMSKVVEDCLHNGRGRS